MLRLRRQPDGVFPRAHQIAHRFVLVGGDVDRGELTGAMEPGERVAVAPVGLDPIAAAPRHARRIDDHAVLALRRQVAMNSKTVRPGFVDEAPPAGRGAQRLDHLRQRLEIAGNPPVVSDLPVAPLLGEMSIESLWTSMPTNMLRFAMACLRCSGSAPTLIGVAQSTSYYVRQVSAPTAILSSKQTRTCLEPQRFDCCSSRRGCSR